MFGKLAAEFDIEPDVDGDVCRITITHRPTKKSWHWEGTEEEWRGGARDKLLADIEKTFNPVGT